MIEQVMDLREQGEQEAAPVMELTTAEHAELLAYEAVIRRGMETFLDVGRALMAIRDDRLYRATHATFDDYCRERWNISRKYAYRTINAAMVIENLSPMGDILPTNERQARPLTALEPEQQREAWQKAVESAPDGKPTAAQVAKATVEFAKPVVYAPVWELERKVGEWLAEQEHIAASLSLDGILETLKVQTGLMRTPDNLLDRLDRWLADAGVTFRKSELTQAINNMRDQRRQGQRQASARVVYTEPAEEEEPDEEEAAAAAAIEAERVEEEQERQAVGDGKAVFGIGPQAMAQEEEKPRAKREKKPKPSSVDAIRRDMDAYDAEAERVYAAQVPVSHEPDPRIAQAQEGLVLLRSVRSWTTIFYHNLTGRDSDTLGFWRDTETMIERLESLISALEGE